MTYRIAGIDVHKKMLAVVIADIAVDGDYQFTHRRVGTSPRELRELAAWLGAEAVEEVVMESTAQYWRPVWEVLERDWLPQRRGRDGASPMAGTLHLAQAQSNKGRRGRKRDFTDAERLVKRLVAQELTLSFVPDAEQRLWRTVMRRKYQLTRNRVQVHNRIEALLEEAHLKLSSLVSDLLGLSARRMLAALAEGEPDPTALAALADRRLRATPEQLEDALGAASDLNPVYRQLIGMALDDLQLIEDQIRQLDQEMACAGTIRPSWPACAKTRPQYCEPGHAYVVTIPLGAVAAYAASWPRCSCLRSTVAPRASSPMISRKSLRENEVGNGTSPLMSRIKIFDRAQWIPDSPFVGCGCPAVRDKRSLIVGVV